MVGGRRFQSPSVRIEQHVLRDIAGLRGNQEPPQYILSARALEVRKKQVESRINKLRSEMQEIAAVQEETKRSQFLGV